MAHKEAFSTAAKNVRSNFLSCLLVQLICKFGSLYKIGENIGKRRRVLFLSFILKIFVIFSGPIFPKLSGAEEMKRAVARQINLWTHKWTLLMLRLKHNYLKNSAISSFKTEGSLITQTNYLSWLKLVISRRFFGLPLCASILSIACPFLHITGKIEVGSIHSIAKTYPYSDCQSKWHWDIKPLLEIIIDPQKIIISIWCWLAWYSQKM